jgi:hypothetical protein
MPNSQSRTVARRRLYRRRRQVAGVGLLLGSLLIVLVGFRVADALSVDQVAPVAGASPAPGAVSKPQLSSAPTSPARQTTRATPTQPTTPRTKVSVKPLPVQPTGVYARAPGRTARHGSGTRLTYRVEVETGTRLGAPAFAAAVDATLADPASWTGQGSYSLQRVDRAEVDFVIRLATPATVDRVCATAGLDTRGYVSCRAGNLVMINLDRWLRAVPEYRGDVALYRHYVINHEVGHQLGYGHQACPGRGRPAPVMQQQTFGLNGCLPNGWPFVAGAFVSGPATR